MGTIHLAGSVACFVIGGLVMVVGIFLGFMVNGSDEFKIDMGRMAVIGFFIVAAGVIIAIKSKN